MKRTGEHHSFNIFIATILKHTNKAILLKEIYGWIHLNRKKNRNVKHGIVWAYMSAEGFSEKFSYMGSKSIDRWLRELVKQNWLYSDNFNQKAYDKTKWYTINFKKYDDAVINILHTLAQNEEWTTQIEEWIAHNEESIPQIEQPIPSPTHLLKQNTISIEEKKQIKDLETDNKDLQKALAETKKLLQEAQKEEKSKKKVKARFVAPTLEISIEYFTGKKSTKDEATNFWYFYESKGWMVGKNKMKKWKAAAGKWIANNKPTNGTTQPETIDTYTLPPPLQTKYTKSKSSYDQKPLAKRISYFTKQEFQSWTIGGTNFEKWRDRGVLTQQDIYRKITKTINELNASSYNQKITGRLVDFVELAFSNKVKRIVG